MLALGRDEGVAREQRAARLPPDLPREAEQHGRGVVAARRAPEQLRADGEDHGRVLRDEVQQVAQHRRAGANEEVRVAQRGLGCLGARDGIQALMQGPRQLLVETRGVEHPLQHLRYGVVVARAAKHLALVDAGVLERPVLRVAVARVPEEADADRGIAPSCNPQC